MRFSVGTTSAWAFIIWSVAVVEGFGIRAFPFATRHSSSLTPFPFVVTSTSSHVESQNTETITNGERPSNGETSAMVDGTGDQPMSSTLLSSLLSSGKGDENTPLTQDPSDQRYSAADWLQNIKSLPGSLILRSIRGTVLTVTLWAFLVSLIHFVLMRTAPTIAARLCVSDKPHSFLASALGLLLVFRTNSAYQRFVEARAIWERILSVSRNLSRMALLMEADLTRDRLERILRLLATFPYMLDDHIHQDDTKYNKKQQSKLKAKYEAENSEDSSKSSSDILAAPRHVYKRQRGSSRRTVGSIKLQYIDTQQLPWCLLPDSTRRRCAVVENRPLYICDRLAREIYSTRLTPNFTHRERATMLGMVDTLSASLGACERIHQTAVPLNYARHALRCVSLWILTLPLALVKDFGLATAPVVMCLAWSYFGVYQIGYTVEDPFQSALRLDTLCEVIYRNVMYGTASMRRRLSALNPEEPAAEWRNLPLPPLPTISLASPPANI